MISRSSSALWFCLCTLGYTSNSLFYCLNESEASASDLFVTKDKMHGTKPPHALSEDNVAK